jgi:hypothetical protein
MASVPPVPEVDVAAVVIQHDGKILAVYNPKWGCFTLPMTKRRRWQDPGEPGRTGEEDWADAAARAAAEWLGTTIHLVSEPLPKGIQIQRSGRDGRLKHYRFHVFPVFLQMAPKLVEGAVAEWLVPTDFLDSTRRPISDTARTLLTEFLD